MNFQPGRLYWTTVRTLVVLRNPTEEIFVDESPKSIIIGKIVHENQAKKISIFTKYRKKMKYWKFGACIY